MTWPEALVAVWLIAFGGVMFLAQIAFYYLLLLALLRKPSKPNDGGEESAG